MTATEIRSIQSAARLAARTGTPPAIPPDYTTREGQVWCEAWRAEVEQINREQSRLGGDTYPPVDDALGKRWVGVNQ